MLLFCGLMTCAAGAGWAQKNATGTPVAHTIYCGVRSGRIASLTVVSNLDPFLLDIDREHSSKNGMLFLVIHLVAVATTQLLQRC